MKRALVCAAVLASAALSAADASAITREEVLVRARAYAVHRWSSTAANQTASCSAGYGSLFPPGDYVGLPYGWGGYMTLRTFDDRIASGYGAGAQESDGILSCIAGVDCSGYVSMAWGAGHYTTSSLHETSSQITTAQLLPGDVFNKAGYHVAMYTHTLQSGEPALIEAAGYNVHVNTFGGWSYVNGYVPRRYSGITGTTAGNPAGTTSNPIPIGAFPFTDARDTRNSPSSVLDACGAAPGTPQRGPEYVYVTNITQPGTLTISVQDDAATDVDVQLLQNLSTTGCIARNDGTISAQVGCGTYWIVVDTYGSNAAKAGPYTLNVSLAPSGQACAAVPGPPVFAPKGKLGDACAYPGNQNLPFCNPNLGSETCIYGASSSFCSKACATNADCTDLGAGSCCGDLGSGELYCMTAPFCGPGTAQDAGLSSGSSGSAPPKKDAGGASSSGGSSSGDEPSPGTSDDGPPPGDPAPSTTTTTAGGCGVGGGSPAGGLAVLAAGALALARARRRSRRGA